MSSDDRQLDPSAKDELARAMSNAAPDDAPASDDTSGDASDRDQSGPRDEFDFGSGNDTWNDFTPIPDLDDEIDDTAFELHRDHEASAPAEPDETPTPGHLDPLLGEANNDVVIVAARATPAVPPAGQSSVAEGGEARTGPKIIRIDDFGGSHAIDDSAPTAPIDPGVAAVSGDPMSRAATSSTAPTQPTSASRVVTISDDELPDAVFIKGSLDSNGQSVIVIDDDGDEAQAPINNPAGTRRSIEPRLRDRRIAIKRQAGRRRLRIAFFVIIALLVVVGIATVFASPIFAVDRDSVTITGAVYTDQGELQAVVDDLVGTPALRVDTKRLEAQLEEIPWVDEARVKVRFPSSATIDIRERKAMATFQGPDGMFRVLDGEGRVLAVLEGYPIAYMLIEIPDAPALAASQQAPIGLVAAAELTKVLTPDLRPRVKSISTVSDGSDLNLNLNDGTRVVFGTATDLIAKVIRLETRLKEEADAAADTSAGSTGSTGDPATPRVIDVSTAETGG